MDRRTDGQIDLRMGRQTGTCRLPREQYSVRMQVFGGSIQAPTNLVRCSFWTSRIYAQTGGQLDLIVQVF